MPRYKLSLCHTPIKPDLLGFPGIGVFACGLRDHVITRFVSEPKSNNDSGAERPKWADYKDFEVDVDDIVDGDFKDESIGHQEGFRQPRH